MSESSATPLDVYAHVAFCLEQSATIAWSKLGLQPDLVTGTLAKDLEQARVAIDLVAHLARILEPTLDPDDRRQVQNLVSNLRVNFVNQSQAGGA